MSLKLGTVSVAGAIALAVSGAAVANTSLDGTTTGDLFLNIVNTSNNTSFLFDTGISQASFNGASSYSFNLGSDANYTSFIAASGTLDYSVLSATNTGATNQTRDTVDFTGTVVPQSGVVNHADQSQAQTVISQFLTTANAVTSSTTNSVYLNSASNFWGQALVEGSVSGALLNVTLPPYADSTTPGTALAFYTENQNTLTTFAGTWNLNGAVLTYGGGSTTVPLPTPILLLLSGIGFMGVVARRRKADSA